MSHFSAPNTNEINPENCPGSTGSNVMDIQCNLLHIVHTLSVLQQIGDIQHMYNVYIQLLRILCRLSCLYNGGNECLVLFAKYVCFSLLKSSWFLPITTFLFWRCAFNPEGIISLRHVMPLCDVHPLLTIYAINPM